MRSGRNHPIVIVAVIALVTMTWAQDSTKREIKHVPIKPTSAASGQQMYGAYCAVCHGIDGKGKGPAAEALRVAPADLTALAEKNSGKYPALKVSAVLRGESGVPAHGSKEMPIWGKLFWSMSGGHESEVQQRIANLNKHIESLQKE
jgi:mono/diheme cytochrome c family protein